MSTRTDRDLKGYLVEKREIVDAALEQFMPPADAPPARLHEAMRYSVFSGGKRLRPILALAAFELVGGPVGGPGSRVLSGACATELVHTYSLIHDDLPAMDDDDTRRGRPSCHRAFDEATAILAGDALLTLAFEIVLTDGLLSADGVLRVLHELALANGSRGMVGGQMADLSGEGTAPTLAAVEYIHTHKTAMPLRAAVLIGAQAAGVECDSYDRLSRYGDCIGLAFQIADDLLDVEGTEEEMGKAVGKDGEHGKLTYPAAVGVERARARADELIEEAVAGLDPFGDDAWVLAAIARFTVDRRN